MTEEVLTVGDVLRLEVARLWQVCCREQGLDPRSPFVVMAGTSPSVGDYNEAVLLLQAHLQRVEGGRE